MYKNNKSMDFCRTGKTMMDYGSKPEDRTMMDNRIKKELREKGFNTVNTDPVTGQKSVSKTLTKAEAEAYKLKQKQIKDDPGSKYDPSKDKP